MFFFWGGRGGYEELLIATGVVILMVGEGKQYVEVFAVFEIAWCCSTLIRQAS